MSRPASSRRSSRSSAYRFDGEAMASLGQDRVQPSSVSLLRRPGTAGPGGPAAVARMVTAADGSAGSQPLRPGEWAARTQRLLLSAAAGKAQSGCARVEARSVKQRASRDTADHDRVVQERLEKKVAQISALRHQLQKGIDGICDEIAELERAQRRAVDALNARQLPLDRVQQRKRIRSSRPEGERLDDDAQHALNSQAEDLCNSVRILDADVRDMDSLMQRMLHSRDAMESDLADKNRAQNLDVGCLDLPATMERRGGTVRERMNAVMRDAEALLSGTDRSGKASEIVSVATARSQHHPTEWREATHRLIREASELVAAARALRRAAKEHQKDTAASNAAHHKAVQKALTERMRATAALHGGLSSRKKEIVVELAQLEKERARVEQALRDQEQPFNQCVERLFIRKNRPSRESAADDVEEGLKDQLNSLVGTIRKLEQWHDRIASRQKQLRETKNAMELDLADKEAAVSVDKQAYQVAALAPPPVSNPSPGGRSLSSSLELTQRSPIEHRSVMRPSRSLLEQTRRVEDQVKRGTGTLG